MLVAEAPLSPGEMLSTSAVHSAGDKPAGSSSLLRPSSASLCPAITVFAAALAGDGGSNTRDVADMIGAESRECALNRVNGGRRWRAGKSAEDGFKILAAAEWTSAKRTSEEVRGAVVTTVIASSALTLDYAAMNCWLMLVPQRKLMWAQPR
eukprot:6179452-Pleurochrysis_carterae.AAC.2